MQRRTLGMLVSACRACHCPSECCQDHILRPGYAADLTTLALYHPGALSVWQLVQSSAKTDVVVDRHDIDSLRSEPRQRDELVHKPMDRTDKVRVGEDRATRRAGTEAVLDLKPRDIGMRQNADTCARRRPALRQYRELRNKQCRLAAAWAGGNVDRRVRAKHVEPRVIAVRPVKCLDRQTEARAGCANFLFGDRLA